MVDVWPLIHAERKALAFDLARLDQFQWSAPSLCADWAVRDVVAHLTATATLTTPRFLVGWVRSGFGLQRMQRSAVAKARLLSTWDVRAAFNGVVGSVRHPPGPVDAWLGETLVHAEDIRRALGIEHEYPADTAVRVANFYKNSNMVIGARRRIAGLALRATDIPWSHGSGAEVSGPIVSLILAMTGRGAGLLDLQGDGLTTLSARC